MSLQSLNRQKLSNQFRAQSLGALNFGHLNEEAILHGSVGPYFHFRPEDRRPRDFPQGSRISLGQYSDHIDRYRDVALWSPYPHLEYFMCLSIHLSVYEISVCRNTHGLLLNWIFIVILLECLHLKRPSSKSSQEKAHENERQTWRIKLTFLGAVSGWDGRNQKRDVCFWSTSSNYCILNVTSRFLPQGSSGNPGCRLSPLPLIQIR